MFGIFSPRKYCCPHFCERCQLYKYSLHLVKTFHLTFGTKSQDRNLVPYAVAAHETFGLSKCPALTLAYVKFFSNPSDQHLTSSGKQLIVIIMVIIVIIIIMLIMLIIMIIIIIYNLYSPTEECSVATYNTLSKCQTRYVFKLTLKNQRRCRLSKTDRESVP